MIKNYLDITTTFDDYILSAAISMLIGTALTVRTGGQMLWYITSN